MDGNELRDSLRPGRRAGVGVEARLGHQLRGEQGGGDVPAAWRRAGAAAELAPGRRRAGRRRPRRSRLPRRLTPPPHGVARLRAGRRADVVSVMPRLPAVALDEAEVAGVGGQPAVGGFRAEVELGGAAVQRVARGRNPGGIGVGGEEGSLFGVGAEGRVDDQGEAAPGRRRPPCGRRRRRRPASSRGPGDRRAGRCSRLRSPSRWPISPEELDGAPASATADASVREPPPPTSIAGADHGFGPYRCERVGVGKGDAQARAPIRRWLSPPRSRPPGPGPDRRPSRCGAGWASRWAGATGESRRGRSSRIERAAEIAARSAARWTRPLPVIAPAIATSASAAAISANAPPSASGRAWPSCPFASMPPRWRALDARVVRSKRTNPSHLTTEPSDDLGRSQG